MFRWFKKSNNCFKSEDEIVEKLLVDLKDRESPELEAMLRIFKPDTYSENVLKLMIIHLHIRVLNLEQDTNNESK